MKRYFITLLASCFFTSIVLGKVITVSNNPNSPGQYNRLDSAINAAASGDELLVSGSLADYNVAGSSGGSITINKPLILYGHGYDPRNDQPLASKISVIHIAYAGSGTTISGFSVGNIYEDAGTHDITISRCSINAFGYGYGGNGSHGIYGNNHNIRENIIGSLVITGTAGGILIQNNIITGSVSTVLATVSNTMITNNYFSNGITSLSNSSVYNNIFYYKSNSTLSIAYVGSNVANCIFNNNIYYNTIISNPFNIGVNNNSGSNNTSANPDFVAIDLTKTFVTRVDNFNLQIGSPGINAGTDGRNIGPEGGSIPIQYPYTGYPAIPVVDSMSILNPVIPPNGTLNVKFSAHSNN